MRVFNIKSSTLSVSVTDTASAAAELPGQAFGSKTVRLVNTGSSACYVAVGEFSVAATVPAGTASQTSTPVVSGGDSVFAIDKRQGETLYISAICASGESTTLIVQSGDGV